MCMYVCVKVLPPLKGEEKVKIFLFK
jgi:hypothetical protein